MPPLRNLYRLNFTSPSLRLPTMFRLHVIPFFEEYWLRRSVDGSTDFPNPEALRVRFEATRALTGESRLRNILLAVAEELKQSSS